MLKNHMSTCKKTHVNMQHLFLMGMETLRGLLIFTLIRSLNSTIPCNSSVTSLWKTFCSPSSWPLSGPLLMLHFVLRTTLFSTLLTTTKN